MMNLARRQHGFTISLGYILGALIMLAVAGRFAWWVATEENFTELAAVLWAIGFVLAYLFTLDDLLVVRMPAGFAVFALLGLAGLPLSWMGESRVVLIALIAAQLAFSCHAGRVISARLRARMHSRYPVGGEPAWLRQKGDAVADFGRWAVLAAGAFVFCAVAPLLFLLLVSLFVDLSPQQVKWAVALWGLAAVTVFGHQARAARWLAMPVCAWIYLAITASLLAVDAVAGPLAKDTGAAAAYIAVPGALIAAFVEVFVLGGGRKISKEEEAK
jgi:hypothetical protein